MPTLLKQEEKSALAAEFGLEFKAVNAVLIVESSGGGFEPETGKIKIQFEPYWFQKFTGKRIANGVEGQKAEWAAFSAAELIDREAALKSTSWGLGQVMGFNFYRAGYTDVSAMVKSFEASEANQLRGMLSFIKYTPAMYHALKTKDWATFAKHYNGPNYRQFYYDTRLAAAYARS